MVSKAKRQLDGGKSPIDVTIPVTVGILRDQTIGWQQAAHDFFAKNPAIVCRSWERCATEGWNLGYPCMTSERAQKALSERLESADSSFKLTLGMEREENEDAMEGHMEGQEHEDDVNIPAKLLAQLHLGNGVVPDEIEHGADGTAVLKPSEMEGECSDQDAEEEEYPEDHPTGASDAMSMSEGAPEEGTWSDEELDNCESQTFDPEAHRPSYCDPDPMSESELEGFDPEELQEMANDPLANESGSDFASNEDPKEEIWEVGESGPGPQSRGAQRVGKFRAPSEIRVPLSLQSGFIDLTDDM